MRNEGDFLSSPDYTKEEYLRRTFDAYEENVMCINELLKSRAWFISIIDIAPSIRQGHITAINIINAELTKRGHIDE